MQNSLTTVLPYLKKGNGFRKIRNKRIYRKLQISIFSAQFIIYQTSCCVKSILLNFASLFNPHGPPVYKSCSQHTVFQPNLTPPVYKISQTIPLSHRIQLSDYKICSPQPLSHLLNNFIQQWCNCPRKKCENAGNPESFQDIKEFWAFFQLWKGSFSYFLVE